MNGKTARKIRQALFDAVVRTGEVTSSQYEIRTVRRADGVQAEMIVCTGYRGLYKDAKRAFKKKSRAAAGGRPDKRSFRRMRRMHKRQEAIACT